MRFLFFSFFFLFFFQNITFSSLKHNISISSIKRHDTKKSVLNHLIRILLSLKVNEVKWRIFVSLPFNARNYKNRLKYTQIIWNRMPLYILFYICIVYIYYDILTDNVLLIHWQYERKTYILFTLKTCMHRMFHKNKYFHYVMCDLHTNTVTLWLCKRIKFMV